MYTITHKVDSLVAEFDNYKDWAIKFNYLIDKGKSLPCLKTEYKQDQYLIKGCQSKVWLHAEYRNGKLFYFADSDSVIIKGIIALLIGVFSDQYPQDVLDSDIEFLEEMGLKDYLSPNRANGVTHTINQIKRYAQEYLNG